MSKHIIKELIKSEDRNPADLNSAQSYVTSGDEKKLKNLLKKFHTTTILALKGTRDNYVLRNCNNLDDYELHLNKSMKTFKKDIKNTLKIVQKERKGGPKSDS